MLVIIANSLPPAVRGLLKVWCLEPKPNVFVTDLNKSMEGKITDFLRPYFRGNTGLLIIAGDDRVLQGFRIFQEANPSKKIKVMSGLQLIEESQKCNR